MLGDFRSLCGVPVLLLLLLLHMTPSCYINVYLPLLNELLVFKRQNTEYVPPIYCLTSLYAELIILTSQPGQLKCCFLRYRLVPDETLRRGRVETGEGAAETVHDFRSIGRSASIRSKPTAMCQ